MEPVDVVMVTHNRLDYLERTVDALFERTPEPIRLTLVDNASEPDVWDSHACRAVREAGYRVGWTPGIRAFHLGWDDHPHYPTHLAAKHADPVTYTNYREVGLIARPPAPSELAQAAPVVAETRAAGVPDASVLELAWGKPVVGAVGGAAADEFAPAGWSGVERPGIGSLPLELARAGGGAGAHAGTSSLLDARGSRAVAPLFPRRGFGGGPRRLVAAARGRIRTAGARARRGAPRALATATAGAAARPTAPAPRDRRPPAGARAARPSPSTPLAN
jgi:Glycosyl transferase family 2